MDSRFLHFREDDRGNDGGWEGWISAGKRLPACLHLTPSHGTISTLPVQRLDRAWQPKPMLLLSKQGGQDPSVPQCPRSSLCRRSSHRRNPVYRSSLCLRVRTRRLGKGIDSARAGKAGDGQAPAARRLAWREGAGPSWQVSRAVARGRDRREVRAMRLQVCRMV